QLAEHFLARGQAHEQIYEYQKAAENYESAIEVAPLDDQAYLKRAWLLATCPDAAFRNGEKALQSAQTAFEKATVRTAMQWDVFAAALAETGDFSEAQKASQNAARIAEAASDPMIRGGLLQEIRARLAEYREEKSHVEPRFAQTFPQSL